MDFLDFYHVNDRRTHRRFAVAMSGRLYHVSGRASPCSISDLSLAGASIQFVSMNPEPVTAFACDETGKLTVTRFQFAEPFVRLVFDASNETRAVIKRALRALGDRQLVQPLPLRRGERLCTRNVMLTRADGTHLVCDILDMSPHGMLVGSDIFPPLGERVSLGRVGGIVVRHHKDGFAIRTQDRSPSNVVRFPSLYRPPSPGRPPNFDGVA
jgi:hypothetical protein